MMKKLTVSTKIERRKVVFSRKTVIETIPLFKFTMHKEVEQFAIKYNIEDHVEGDSISKRMNALSRYLVAESTDKVHVEEIITDAIDEELRILQQYHDFHDTESFESKYPKLYESLRNDGYSIVDGHLQKVNIIEVGRQNMVDKLELIHRGEGSYAHVYSYTDHFYNQTFALKRAKTSVLNAKELTRFKNEYSELRNLDSPYIVKVFNYNEENNEYTMEYMQTTLHKYIMKNNTKISMASRISIIQQIFRAVTYIHSKARLHRDLSTSNILITTHDDGTVIAKVSDFGLVMIPGSTLTDPNTAFKGSLNDPNLKITGFSKYEVRHEVYALTQLINYVLTGHTEGGLYDRDIEVNAYLTKGLDPDINNRFSTIEEMSIEFLKIRNLIK